MQNDTPIEKVKSPTPGEWFVSTVDKQIVVMTCKDAKRIILATLGDDDAPNADELIANAALFAISKNMLEALIVTSQELMTSKKPIDLEALNQIYSDVFAKLANEAGEEL